MKKWSILILACAFCATIFSCTNQAESEEEMGKMYVAENDFIRVEFHSRTNAEGSLNDCIGGGGNFFITMRVSVQTAKNNVELL